VIVLRFGNSGRLARICDTALKLVAPAATMYSANRAGEFVPVQGTAGLATHGSVASLLQAHAADQVTLLDTSVDHSTTANLVAHETFKRNVITTLHSCNALAKAIGFSSGITLVNGTRIQPTAQHMLAYRTQKIAQEKLFDDLACPVFIPNVFTLVGPITYKTQGAAWAQILRARVQGSTGTVLHEPDAKKAWVAEFSVFKAVLSFLANPVPPSIKGALVDGVFTLSDIAKGASLPLPELSFTTGSAAGWLEGDYIPARNTTGQQTIHEELLRALFQ